MHTSTPAPAVVAHPTRAGVWLIPDTRDGRELMEAVKESPRLPARPAADRVDPFRVQTILGALAAAALYVAVRFAHPVFAVIGALLIALLVWSVGELALIRADERRLRSSGLAVPLPESLWGDDARPNGRRELAALAQLPDVQGIPALALVWLAGQHGAAETAAEAVHAAAAARASAPARESAQRQAEIVQGILREYGQQAG